MAHVKRTCPVVVLELLPRAVEVSDVLKTLINNNNSNSAFLQSRIFHPDIVNLHRHYMNEAKTNYGCCRHSNRSAIWNGSFFLPLAM